MTDVNTTLPPALGRALGLLVDPPTEPDVRKGYRDLLGAPTVEDGELAQNTDACGRKMSALFSGWLRPALTSPDISPADPSPWWGSDDGRPRIDTQLPPVD